MKKRILLATIFLVVTAGLAQAQTETEPAELGVSLDVKYMSSYIWRGFDYYADDHPALDVGLNIDLYGSGFGIGIVNRRALTGEFVNSENLNVSLYYGSSMLEGESTTNYTVGWVYYGYPDEPRSGSPLGAGGQAADMQELFAAFSWPNICPMGIVPSYTVLTMWPSEGDSAAHQNAGWAHVLGLGYDLSLATLSPELPAQMLNLSAVLVYNDGVAPGVVTNAASGSIEHDWSHAVLGVSTNFQLDQNMTVTPGFYHQLSMEDSVNSGDETWFTVNMNYKF